MAPRQTTSLYYKVNVRFVHRNWYKLQKTDTHTEGEREGGRERVREGETETPVKEVLASGVPPKG